MLSCKTFSACFIFLLALGISLHFGCGGTGGTTGSGTGTTGGGTGTTGSTTSGTGTSGGTGSSEAGPVILVVEENHGFATVIGNSAIPYVNSLAQQYALGTQYYANTHPSINNYFEMTAGNATVAPPPNPDTFDGPVNVDNLVRHLIVAGKTWKSYAESLPSVGYTGRDSGAYLHHHNPLSYFTDVVNSPAQRGNLVPFDQFATDLNAGALPSFSFVAPNKNNNAHSCPAKMAVCLDIDKLKAADNWLKTNIDPVLSSAQFKQNGLLIIVFDEAEPSDTTHGGGQVAVVVIGPKVKTMFRSTTLHQHQDLLKMITTYIGIDSNIGDAANAAGMAEFFQ